MIVTNITLYKSIDCFLYLYQTIATSKTVYKSMADLLSSIRLSLLTLVCIKQVTDLFSVIGNHNCQHTVHDNTVYRMQRIVFLLSLKK